MCVYGFVGTLPHCRYEYLRFALFCSFFSRHHPKETSKDHLQHINHIDIQNVKSNTPTQSTTTTQPTTTAHSHTTWCASATANSRLPEPISSLRYRLQPSRQGFPVPGAEQRSWYTRGRWRSLSQGNWNEDHHAHCKLLAPFSYRGTCSTITDDLFCIKG